MSDVTVGITGATGYVGRKVTEYLDEMGYEVYPLSRNSTRRGRGGGRDIQFSLRDGVEATELERLDCVVHLAYDFSPTSWEDIVEVNVDGTIDLFDTARATDTHVVQISSLSAFTGCKSKYGRAKLLLEQEAFERDFHVIRPGLVFGRELGSTLGGLDSVASNSPVVPVPTGGPHVHYQCHYADLAELVERCCSKAVSETTRPIVAASERSRTFREIMSILSEHGENDTRFLPVPKSLMYYGLRSTEALGLDIGLRSDSVVGLVHPNSDPDFGATRETGVRFRAFDTHTLSEGLFD